MSFASGRAALSTARITSESLPTPDGSITMRSGEKSSTTLMSAFEKSPTSEQQIQPEFISVISTPASARNPPSIPISPNSFSIRTTFSPAYASLISFFISVVFPAPRKPEKISILVIVQVATHLVALPLKYFIVNYNIIYIKSQYTHLANLWKIISKRT